MHQFSIITPAFNRAKYLPRIYDCLIEQGNVDFEWIIIDDGSSDNTREVVSNFEKSFVIKYAYQENAGKPSAMNAGFQMADSYITLSALDSEDILCPNVLETVWSFFDVKGGKFEHDCVCLSGLCQNENRDLLGMRFPHDYYVSDYIRYIQNLKITGDKCEFFITEILKKYPYPVFKNEKNIAPSYLHIRIAWTYKTLYVNKIFMEKLFLEGGLSTQNYWLKYPLSSELYYNDTSIPPLRLKLQMRYSGEYIFYAKMNNKKSIFKNAKNKLIFPLGMVVYCKLSIKHFLKKFSFCRNVNKKIKKLLKIKSIKIIQEY